MGQTLLKYKSAFSWTVVLYLVVFNSWTNSSKTDAYIELEKLSDTEVMDLNRLFYAEKALQIDSFLHLANFLYNFNGSALVAIDHQAVLEEGYGFADFASKEILTADHSFQLASVSKQFTAVSILMLYERGQLALSDKVTKYLSSLPYPEITIEQLLTHTSGIPNYLWFMENEWKATRIPNNDDLIKVLATNLPQAYFSPGRLHDYSNTGYAVLAAIIEKVTGKAYPEFVAENIFAPLGMKNSYVFKYSKDDQFEDRIKGYSRSGRYWREIPPTVNDGIVGDKGIYASVRDLFLWDQSLYQNRLISDSLTQKAFSHGILKSKREINYGFGFRIRYEDDIKIVYHNGKWEGFRNAFHRYIHDGNTIILLSNTDCRQIETIRKKIEFMINETPVNDDLLVIQGTIEFGYSFGNQLVMQKRAKNPRYKINAELLDSTIKMLDSLDKKQLSLILSQMRQFV